MKKVALACTGGGVKACANIGVIKALNELNIEIEAISGASLGALISLLYLCGYNTDEMKKIFQEDILKCERYNLLEALCAIPNLLIKGGSKNPKEISNYIKKLEKKHNLKIIKDIDKPLIIPALDISDREVIYYSSKPLEENCKYYTDRTFSEALRSTCAIPLMFTPNKVIIDGKNHFMLDGGILTNTLIRPLRQFSNYVIGVTSKFYPKQRKRINLGTGFTQTFQSMRREFLSEERQAANFWIEVELKTNKFTGGKKEVEQYIELGYKTTMEYAKQHYFDEIIKDDANV